ncbi:MAG: uracil-DNA glycosylase [Candidatus Onthovivens sp.]|nr:uracil-DNA glycosylase [Candidatus Onthovivens sp.]
MQQWEDFLKTSKYLSNYEELLNFIDEEYKEKDVFPPKENIFRAFDLTGFSDVKIVIIGQDPYSNEGQANGLAFSVNKGITPPPSLKNIVKEIGNEFNSDLNPNDYVDLSYLSTQGVLLLNSILTVDKGKPLSHNNNLYKEFINNVIEIIEKNDNPIVYLLWGTYARKYSASITNKNHIFIETNHPSPLSANRGGRFNSNCFLRANEFLINHNAKPIEWIIKKM